MDDTAQEPSEVMRYKRKDRRVKFESFTDRIKRIRIDILPRCDLSIQVPNEKETFFYEGVLKWRELNEAADFCSLLTLTRDKIQTLHLLLHHREFLLESIITAISQADELSLEPMLDLIVQLARDLQQEFSPHFARIFPVLTARLASKDASVLELVFSCLAHLLKILWRHLIAHSDVICDCYSPLLSSQREYIQRFAAESLSFLLRRSLASNQQQTLHSLYKILSADSTEGVGTVLFEMMKGPPCHLHSCTPGLLTALLDQLSESDHTLFLAVNKATQSLVRHSNTESAKECIDIMLDRLCESVAMSDVTLSRVLTLCGVWAGPDRCRLTCDSLERCVSVLMRVCKEIGQRQQAWYSCMDLFLVLVRANLRVKLVEMCNLVARVSEVLECVTAENEWCVKGTCDVIEGILPLVSEEMFKRYILEPWITLSERIILDNTATDRVLYCWTQILSKVSEGGDSEKVGEEGEKRIKIDSSNVYGANLLTVLANKATLPPTEHTAANISCMCMCVQSMRSPPEETLQLVEDNLKQLPPLATSHGGFILTTLRDCMLTLVRTRDLHTVLPPSILTSLLSLYPTSYSLLEAIQIYCSTTLPHDVTEELVTILVPSLSSPFSHVRQKTLGTLTSLSHTHPLDIDLLQLCTSSENTQADLLHYKEKIGYMRRLVYRADRCQLMTEIGMRLLLSQFYTNFSPIWSQVRQLVTSYATEEAKGVFWKVLSVELELTQLEDGADMILDISNHSENLEKWFLSRENQEKEMCRKARADISNYQVQLWQTLQTVSPFCESRSRLLVPILTRYMEQWFVPKETGREALQEIGTAGEVKREERDRRGGRHKQIAVSMLELFSQFKHPQNLYQADGLRNLYLRLLAHPLSDIQTSALSCLVSLQLKYLSCYHDNLIAVITEKNLSSILTVFSSESSEVRVLAEEHRSHVIPILCRVLYGILLRQGSAERSSPTQTAILQFLTSCDTDEIACFLDLTLSPFQQMISEQTMDAELDLSVVPLKKQISFLTLLKHLFFHLSTQIPDIHLTVIITLLNNTCLRCAYFIRSREMIQRWAQPLIKSIRSLAINRLIDVTNLFPNDVILSREDQLFSSLITPSLSRSQSELSQAGSLLELIVAWSAIPECAGFFERVVAPEQPPLISYVINTLNEKNVNKRAADSILDTTLNLLHHSDKLVAPHIDTILRFISNELSTARREKRSVREHTRELDILSLASVWVQERDADALVDNISHFLTARGARYSQVTVSILTSVKNLVSRVQHPERVCAKLSPLLSQLTEREERGALIAVFIELSTRLQYTSIAVRLCQDMDAWKEDEIDEMDYVRRNNGFSEARQGLKEGKFEEQSLRILAFTCIHFLFSNEEITLRNLAVEFLQNLIEWNCLDIYRPVISRCVIPAIKRGIKSQNMATRSECIGLLACVTKRFSNKEKFSELLTLVNKDREVDVFDNLVHIQLHRRTAAIAKLSKLSENDTFSPLILRQYLLPIVSHFLHCSQHDREHNLLSNAIEFVGRASGQLGWAQYVHMLKQYLRMVATVNNKLDESVTIRVLISILHNYHFDVSERVNKDTVALNESENEDEDIKVSNSGFSGTIQDVMSNHILPELEALLDSSPTSHTSGGHKLSHLTPTGCDIRAPVALAIVQLLLKLPQQLMDCHLPGILLKLIRALHTRDWDMRQDVRRVLREVAVSIGAGYLERMFSEMQQQLTRGFQLHILTYTVHSILDGMKKRLKPGDLDGCVRVLSEIVVNDLFGRPSEERAVRELAVKTVEVRHPKGPEVLELMSTFLSPDTIHGVLDPFLEKLVNAEVSSTVELVREGLKKVSQGLLRNRAMTSHKLLVFVYQQLVWSVEQQTMDFVSKEDCLQKQAKYLEEVKRDCFIIESRVERGGARPKQKINSNIQLVTEFCLSLLSSALKTDRKINLHTQTVLEKLDPFIEILTNLLSAPHLRIAILSVRILGQVCHLKLPSLLRHTHRLKTHILSYLRKYSTQREPDSPNNEMVSTCYRVMTSLLNQQGSVTVSRAEIEPLLVSLEEAIHQSSRQATVFSLLKAIIRSGVGSKSLWQLMTQVAKLCVQEESEQVKREARSALLLYLTETAISRKRIKLCLDYILSNLEYQLEPGRQSAAKLTTLVLRKFPREILNDLAEYFYLPVAIALANEDSKVTRRLYELSLKSLFSKVDSSRMDNIYSMGWEWIRGDNNQLIYMGGCSLLVLIETGVGPVNKKLTEILKQLISIITQKQDSRSLMKVCVECILKMVRKKGVATLCRGYKTVVTDVAQACVSLINSEEKDTRVVTAKLVGALLSHTKHSPEGGVTLFREHTQLVSCAQSFVDRVNSPDLCEEETAQVVKNLIFLFTCLLREHDLTGLKYLLRQLVKKATLEAVLTPKQVVNRKCTYQLLAATALTMDSEELRENIGKFVKPLFYEVNRREQRGRRVEIVSHKLEEVKALAQQCLDLIKNKVGTEVYNQHLLSLQKRAGEVRTSRRSYRSRLATTDPVRFANMKLRKHTRQSSARKRKIASKSLNRKFKANTRKLAINSRKSL